MKAQIIFEQRKTAKYVGSLLDVGVLFGDKMGDEVVVDVKLGLFLSSARINVLYHYTMIVPLLDDSATVKKLAGLLCASLARHD